MKICIFYGAVSRWLWNLIMMNKTSSSNTSKKWEKLDDSCSGDNAIERMIEIKTKIVKHLAWHTHQLSSNIVSMLHGCDKCMHKMWINWRENLLSIQRFLSESLRISECFSVVMCDQRFPFLFFPKNFFLSRTIFLSKCMFRPCVSLIFAPIFDWANWILCVSSLSSYFWLLVPSKTVNYMSYLEF